MHTANNSYIEILKQSLTKKIELLDTIMALNVLQKDMLENPDLDPDELEEERRLCYVGITRAMKRLTITCAKQRMVRGETQYYPISRFLREIPICLVQTGREQVKTEQPVKKMPDVHSPYMQAKKAFKSKAFDPNQFKVKKADSLDYAVGDQVRHIKFGVGTVENIIDGGKDYEVTVNFEKAGVKKMFAAFAKLRKV